MPHTYSIKHNICVITCFHSCETEEAKNSSVTQFSITLVPLWNTDWERVLKSQS